MATKTLRLDHDIMGIERMTANANVLALTFDNMVRMLRADIEAIEEAGDPRRPRRGDLRIRIEVSMSADEVKP